VKAKKKAPTKKSWRRFEVIDSGSCSVDWLCEVLPVPWFGDCGIYHNPATGDIQPVWYGRSGAPREVMWS